MLAYSYARFSSWIQTKSDSLRRQLALTVAWCERNGVTLSQETFSDLGVSGWTGENWREGGLSLFLEAIRAGKIAPGSYLIVENLDRLSRDQIDKALALFCEIIRAGVKIVTLMPERLYTIETLSNPMALIEAILTFVLANEESSKKSKRLKENWNEKRRTGGTIGGLMPAWLRWEKDSKTYHVIEDKADVVRQIYLWSAEGLGSYAIMRNLHGRGIGSIGKGGRWNHSYISLLLHHRGVIGERVLYKDGPGGRRIPDVVIPAYYPPIVSTTTFYQVQEALTVRDGKAAFRGRGANNYRNLFSGLLVDARDGCSLIYHQQRKGSMKKVWKYVVNHDALRRVAGSCFITFPYPELENAILLALSSHLTECFVTHEDVGLLTAREGELREVRGNLDVLRARILSGAKAKTLVTLVEDLDQKAEALEKEIEQLRGQLAADPVEDLDRVLEGILAMQQATGKERDVGRARLQGSLRKIVDKVYVLLSKSNQKRGKQGNPFDKHAFVEVRLRNGQFWQMALTYWGGEIVTEWEGQSGVSLASLPAGFDVTDPFARLGLPE